MLNAEKEINRQIGLRLRHRRQELGFSQQKIGQHVGVTFQQVQKWEAGTNRISAARLKLLAPLLEVEITYFYE